MVLPLPLSGLRYLDPLIQGDNVFDSLDSVGDNLFIMYGKSFESKYEGSMVGAGVYVFAVWDYCITKNRSGIVELNPKLLAFVLDGDADGSMGSAKHIQDAIDYLLRPDAESRSKESEGRRLIKEGAFQYRMVNWAAYDGLKSLAEQREYNRRKQAEYREKKRRNTMDMPSSPVYRQAEERAVKKFENGEVDKDFVPVGNPPSVLG